MWRAYNTLSSHLQLILFVFFLLSSSPGLLITQLNVRFIYTIPMSKCEQVEGVEVKEIRHFGIKSPIWCRVHWLTRWGRQLLLIRVASAHSLLHVHLLAHSLCLHFSPQQQCISHFPTLSLTDAFLLFLRHSFIVHAHLHLLITSFTRLPILLTWSLFPQHYSC